MATVSVERVEDVGPATVALDLETPADFEAYPGQFVLVRATVEGEEETGYYTISSPDVAGVFEITVGDEGTLGGWLAAREVGETVEIEGPFGDVKYTGDSDVAVLAGGPGIGPAIGIAERATAADHDATVVFSGEEPPHRERLDALEDGGATVVVVEQVHDAATTLARLTDEPVYVFGFQRFVDDALAALEASGLDPDDALVESFGPA